MKWVSGTRASSTCGDSCGSSSSVLGLSL
jgi:hypothetical protein